MPIERSPEKIKKNSDTLVLELTRTKDILKALGQRKREGQILAGFALETTGEQQYARDKLKNKHADLIVLNSLNDEGAGFGMIRTKSPFSRGGGWKSPTKGSPSNKLPAISLIGS